MSKTIRNGPSSKQRAGGNEVPDKEEAPQPYPPIEPTVAQGTQEQKER